MDGQSSDLPTSGHHGFVEEKSYERMANAIDPGRTELDAKLEAITFVIARIPRAFRLVRGSETLRAGFYTGIPQMRIWFSFDGTLIHLWGIEVIDEP